MTTTSSKFNAKFNDSHWRESYSSRSYATKDSQYEDYETAYQVGHEGCDRYESQSFDEAEFNLKQDYDNLCQEKGSKPMAWEQAKQAVRDAWDEAAAT